MHDTIQQVNYCKKKNVITCSYRLTYITICRATITAKPTDITTYSATITDKQLSCIITIYYNTYLLLKPFIVALMKHHFHAPLVCEHLYTIIPTQPQQLRCSGCI